ncbi:hypothetical protein ACM9HF_06275 [Colwellia sp. RE-S-Sl-9]
MSVKASSIADYLVYIEEQESENVELIEEQERISHKISRIKEDLSMNAEEGFIKNIQIEVVELTDNQGLKYVGGKVSKADLSVYLQQMKNILGNEFSSFRERQAIRDHHTFHVTLINPYELQAVTKTINFGEKLSVSLLGLGRVLKEDQATYFVVAQSPEAQYFRQLLVLPAKDFHVTLGFKPKDIFGVSKNETSLIKGL